MIPIRRYPYTDLHDLNLDYLLRQVAEFEEDLEELKRRVKNLEDWKIIIDGDITTIKGDIITIKGDIVDIKGDIVDIKTDIDILSENNIKYYFMVNGANLVEIRKNNPAGSDIVPLSTITDCMSFMNILSGQTLSDKGTIIPEIFIVDISSLPYKYYKTTYFVIGYDNLYVRSLPARITPSSQSEIFINITTRQDALAYAEVKRLTPPTFDVNSKITISSDPNNIGWNNNTDPDTMTDYPYYWSYLPSIPISKRTFVAANFVEFTDFLTYSDIISDFIETTDIEAPAINGRIKIYFKEKPASNFSLELTIMERTANII